MQDDFEHLPFAPVLQQWSQKTSESNKEEKTTQEAVQNNCTWQSLDTPCKKPKKTRASHVSSHTSVHASTPSPLTEEESLFLQAVGSLITKQGAASRQLSNDAKAQKGRSRQNKTSYTEKAHKNSLEAQGAFPLYERESFSQLFSPKSQKIQANQKSLPLSDSMKNTEKSTDSVHGKVGMEKEEHTPSMQELLQAQEAISMGHDGEGMDAFFKAMKEVQPLAGKGRDIAPEVQPLASAVQGQDAFALMMEKKLEFSLALKGEYIEGHVVGLDELTMNNLRAGVYSPEAHLDMHGLNAEQAYQALVGFFKSSWYKGMRTLLLIPGRGKNSPNGVSVLREKVQLWLTQDPFKRVVLAFCTAQPVDGGPGTVYVLLRKYRKKGKICWERLPSDPDLY